MREAGLPRLGDAKTVVGREAISGHADTVIDEWYMTVGEQDIRAAAGVPAQE
jgi:hypothetical protein